VRRVVLSLAGVLFAAGCSAPQLDRATAARVIQEAAEFREPGFVGVNRAEALSDCAAKLREDAAWGALSKAGWLAARNEDDFEHGVEGRPAVKCVGHLAGDGLRAGVSVDTTTYRQWRVPAATRELVAVTSVTPSQQGISTVRFTFRWRLNVFGREVYQPGGQLAGEAVLRSLNDGWHAASFTALPGFSPLPLSPQGEPSP
jgi:hypothetical protein